MQKYQVEIIFDTVREKMIGDRRTSLHPVAILLGGQPASGKSKLAAVAEREHMNETFLKVNGDAYRIYHPEHDKLTEDIKNYSEKTQLLSNIFTEKLIEEAIKSRFSIIVEGTMRNPETTLKTAAMFKTAGFKTEAYVIAAPEQFTEVGIYHRYLRELQIQGYGRLSDMQSHSQAVAGLIKTVNELYRRKAVDKISIHTLCAKEKVKDFYPGRDYCTSPGDAIRLSRDRQFNNKELFEDCLKRLEYVSKHITAELKEPVHQLRVKMQQMQYCRRNSMGLSF
jgi:adenylate kinase family enzyme